MFTLLPHTEEIFWVDCQVLAGIRGVKSLPLLPAIAKPITTRWRPFSLSSRLLCRCQRCLDQGRRKSTEARILRQPCASRSWRKIPAHKETHLCISHGSPQTQAVLSSSHGIRPDQQAPTTSDEQSWHCWMIGTLGHRIKQVQHLIPPANRHQRANCHRLHSEVHSWRRQRGKRISSVEHTYKRII